MNNLLGCKDISNNSRKNTKAYVMCCFLKAFDFISPFCMYFPQISLSLSQRVNKAGRQAWFVAWQADRLFPLSLIPLITPGLSTAGVLVDAAPSAHVIQNASKRMNNRSLAFPHVPQVFLLSSPFHQHSLFFPL